jgi:hypothetical protein
VHNFRHPIKPILKFVVIHILPLDYPKNVKSFLAKTYPTGLNQKKWLVLIRPSLAGFESTADTDCLHSQCGFLPGAKISVPCI